MECCSQLTEEERGCANAELLGGMLWGYGWGLLVCLSVLALVVHPLFHPLPGRALLVHLRFAPCRARLTFFVLPKKVSKERRARDGDFPLNFRNRAGKGKTRFAQTVSLPFSARLQKFKAPSRAQTSKAKPTQDEGER